MGKIRRSPLVKLVSGFIFKEDVILKKAEGNLKKLYGRIDYSSPVLDFNYTDYYVKEFGLNLKRKFISFEKLILPERLSKIKIAANKIEEKFYKNNSRRVNIDPGYLDLAKLVLATTKDYNHRIYLSRGIYAEVTLCYQGNTFKPWNWTYRDYQSQEYTDIFNQIREIYHKQIL
ncbi:MAG: DUF4416 family protein [Candidatus Omnitrophota bacterium]